jgi:DNA-directed RNA polymerase specialized sigma54-like protein
MKKPLSDEEQAQARQLVESLRPRAEAFLEQMAQLLVANQGAPFGQGEFDLRDLLHRFGADALEASLAEKKTATRGVP